MTAPDSQNENSDENSGIVQPPEAHKVQYGNGWLLTENEYSNQPGTVGRKDFTETGEVEETIQLGQFNPAYLRQWAELLEFAYGKYTMWGSAMGSVHLELRKRGPVWLLVGLPEYQSDKDLLPVVCNKIYTESGTALPDGGDDNAD
jgi:hypothetical protein